MSVFCCCRPRRVVTEEEPGSPALPPPVLLPTLPPPAKVHENQLIDHPIVQRQGTANSRQSGGESPSYQTSMPTGEAPIELGQLVVEDSESDEEGIEPFSRKNGSTLDVVRTKFIRHLSQETDAKRQSRISVGNSDEEVARRAELKRLMHKRIQDELKSEGRQSDSSGLSAQSTQYLAPLIDHLPAGGLRDALEFSVADATAVDADNPPQSTQHTGQPVSGEDHISAADADADAERRRSSCPESFPRAGGKGAAQAAIRERSSLPEIPPSPVLPPLRPPSTHDSVSLKSWRLSYSASQLDRVLGLDTVIPGRCPSQSAHSQDGSSALGTWLIAQGLRSREQSLARLDDADVEKATPHPQTSNPPPNSGRADGVDLELPDIIHLYDMDIHGELAPRELNSRQGSLRMSKASSVQRKESHASRISRRSSQILDGCVSENRLAVAPVDASSSVYPSMMSSLQPTPRTSRANLNEVGLQTKSIHGLDLSPFKWLGGLEGDKSDQSSYKTARDNDSNLSLTMPGVKDYRRPTIDACSMAVSETSSYFHREAELKTIEKRFGDSLSRRIPRPPVHTKFRENFEGQGPPVAVTRSSFLQKLHIPLPRRSKVELKGPDDLRISDASPITSPSPSPPSNANASLSPRSKKPSNLSIRSSMHPLSSSPYRSPALQESATDLWQRAIRLEQESRESKSKANAEAKKSGSVHLKVGRWKGTRRSRSDGSDFTAAAAAATPSNSSQADDTPSSDPRVSPSWLKRLATQRQDQELRGKARVRDAGDKKFTKKLTKPPESWSQWPSHTRVERTAAASAADNVKSKDFAITHVSENGRVEWATDRSPTVMQPDPQLGARSFSGKLGKAVKTGFGKFLPTKSGLLDDAGNTLKGRQGSFQASGQLDYPELEILPTEGGYKELKALEQEIETMKNSQRFRDWPPIGSEPRSSLAAKLPAMMQAAKHERHGCGDTSSPVETDAVRKTSDIQVRPITPSNPQAQHARDSTTATTERYATPLSHMSQSEVASPLPMEDGATDDVGSVKSDSTVVRRSKSAVERRRGQNKFATWNGRSKTQPVMMKSTLDFGMELEKMLSEERERAFAAGTLGGETEHQVLAPS